MNVVGIIPARLQSSRLPEKLLLQETGKPLLQYVWEVAMASSTLDDVIIATDSERIFDTVHSFGGHAEMTADHPSGTDRVAEIARRCCADAEVIVNLQGDEPELEADTIEALVAAIHHGNTEMATVAAPIRDASVVSDPDCVKVVVDNNGQALYFSRSPIPFSRDASIAELLSSERPSPWLLHVGLYAYRREFLLSLTSMPPSSLERLEKLEQLRALQSGARIAVAVVPQAAVGIDTAEDYTAFVQRQSASDTR
ncbi:MAG TPA: 3-deoxy-manno-octulosonate cytidylyltransferase [Planctomycetes bacterium]|nr:3-deoxy-manno-octulosonate cytidylyltransferase [Fuerstiella sp.]HIK96327.1 3-deoxy-manno-octulosonate cytidylyltransferase [Planctomycetota bacterium]